MKRWLWYIGIIVAIAVLSGKASAGEDIGKLQPVQVVYLSSNRGQIILQTDTGDCGVGENLKEAFDDMKASASREVFLDTADYLLLSPECESLIPAMAKKLRPSCGICLTEGQPDMGQVGAFLQHHSPGVTLTRYRAGERELEKLVNQEGGMELVS